MASGDSELPSAPNPPVDEDVATYPRPPRLEKVPYEVSALHDGKTIAKTSSALRVLETTHPPTYYIPMKDTFGLVPSKSARKTFCEWKGEAKYFDLVLDGKLIKSNVAWTYASPTPSFTAIKDHVCIYPSAVSECFVNGEKSSAQPGDFYGGWVNSWIKGSIKGAPGTTLVEFVLFF